MSFNIAAYHSSKSVKLSDSYAVRLINSKDESVDVLCASFTVPKPEFHEEVYNYGNVGQTFLIPNYESVKEVTIELFEIPVYIKNFFVGNGQAGLNYSLSQKFDKNNFAKNTANYNSLFDFKNLFIEIYSNNLKDIVYTYKFDDLKISKYSTYDLDYTSDALCKMSISFFFQKYEKFDGPYVEPKEAATFSYAVTDFNDKDFNYIPERLKSIYVEDIGVVTPAGQRGLMATVDKPTGYIRGLGAIDELRHTNPALEREIMVNAGKLISNSKTGFISRDINADKLIDITLVQISQNGNISDSEVQEYKRVINEKMIDYQTADDKDKEIARIRLQNTIANIIAEANYKDKLSK